MAVITARRPDIDWLRVLAVLLLIPFHSCLIFVQDPGSVMYIKASEDSGVLNAAASFIHQFHMPLLFLLAGASSSFALSRRSAGQYIAERFRRLVIPAVFGIVVLIPPMTYITRLARGEEISFLAHWRRFFVLNTADLPGIYGTLTPAHLWFVLFLFVFSLAGLPLFSFFKSQAGREFIGRVTRFFTTRFVLLLFAIPLALGAAVEILADKNPLVYFLYFCLGYFLMTDTGMQKAVTRDAPALLVLGIVFELIRQNYHLQAPEWSLPWILYGSMETLNRWVWVLAILGLGQRCFRSGGKLLNRLSAAAFPVYVLHLPINTLVGYAIIQVDAAVGVKYVLIVVVTAAATLLAYEGARFLPPLRLLLGIKSIQREQARPASVERIGV